MPEPVLRFSRNYELACGTRNSHCIGCERTPEELAAQGAPPVLAGVGRVMRARAATPCPATATGDHYIASYARAEVRAGGVAFDA